MTATTGIKFGIIVALAAAMSLALVVPAAQADHTDDTMGEFQCTLEPGGVSGQAETGDEDGVNAIFTDDLDVGGGWDALQLMDTDPGHFNFSGNVVCSGTDNASEAGQKTLPEPFANVEAEIIASGDFDNLTCGTGTANGDAVLRSPRGTPAGPHDIQVFTEFGIKFVEGAGQLAFVVDADETGVDNGGGQLDTAPDGALGGGETWAGSDMGDPGSPGGVEYTKNGGHSYIASPDGDNQVDGGMGTGEIDILPDEPNGGGDCLNQNVTQFLVNGEFRGFLSGEGSAVSDGNADPDKDSDG